MSELRWNLTVCSFISVIVREGRRSYISEMVTILSMGGREGEIRSDANEQKPVHRMLQFSVVWCRHVSMSAQLSYFTWNGEMISIIAVHFVATKEKWWSNNLTHFLQKYRERERERSSVTCWSEYVRTLQPFCLADICVEELPGGANTVLPWWWWWWRCHDGDDWGIRRQFNVMTVSRIVQLNKSDWLTGSRGYKERDHFILFSSP